MNGGDVLFGFVGEIGMRLRSIIIMTLALVFGLGAALLAQRWLDLQVVPVQASEPRCHPKKMLMLHPLQLFY